MQLRACHTSHRPSLYRPDHPTPTPSDTTAWTIKMLILLFYYCYNFYQFNLGIKSKEKPSDSAVARGNNSHNVFKWAYKVAQLAYINLASEFWGGLVKLPYINARSETRYISHNS